MKPLASNTLLQNRYLVVHLIGRGGMGEVYLAIDQRLGSAVALKRTAFFEDATLGNAFEREARTLARLRHAVLPKASDHFVEDGNQYLVMEYIAGDDLSKRLEMSGKPFPLNWVVFWTDQILEALDYLHSNEPPIIHRDIKPQNLKLTEENAVVLLDFGLSKNTVDAARPSTTAPSVVGYTPQYAPLEQIRGTGTNARSDIFSLSSTVYQLLTNRVPPDALTRADALLSEQPDPLLPVNQINPLVPPAISAIILKGMEISRDKRFSSAREMQKLLRDAYTPDVRKSTETIADSSAAPIANEGNSLKTNVVSIPNFEARASQSSGRADTDNFIVSPNSRNFDSAPMRKPASDSAFTALDGDKRDAFATSIPARPASPFSIDEKPLDYGDSISGENKIRRKSTAVPVGIGAILLVFAAVGFGFYAVNSLKLNSEKAPTEAAASAAQIEPTTTPANPKPEPTKETAAAEDVNAAGGGNIGVADSVEEKPRAETSGASVKIKAVQPPPTKINQKAAPSPEAKNSRPLAKPTPPNAAKQPTPLPRILP